MQAATRASPLPTGTVTLLFTDIEGSTQHWERQRAAMPEVLRRHDELMRSAIESNSGYVFKTVGDAFCAAFWRAGNAVAAAADAQRALQAEDWSAVGGLQARMALHSGATDEREGDYFGPPVNRVARLLATAHGGQVVVSGATAQLLRGVMPETMELRDLGEHRLKDLIEPERVSQLIAPGLPEKFPPLRSLESLPNNLQRQLTPLIGRDDVLAEIEPLAIEHPLVTLAGTGGVGKTRVALQVGADLLDGLGDGVWFVELAPLTDPASVAGTIASTFRLREQPDRPVLETLLQYLKPRRLLLILDNCEHLIDEVAKVADAILQGCPEVRLLATSREPLRIDGEHVYRMPSLAVPPQSDSLTAEEAVGYGAVALFAQRAAASDAKFTLTDESAPIVAEICRRLDGIALAIELAAARVKILAPRQLSQKLDERFRVLTGGSRTALPRQQTMRALIDWSYDLLSEQEQTLFRRVAIFVGGWTLEAAEAVGTDETLDALDIVDLLSSLAEKSLVVADLEQSYPRYRLLESTRAFALEKLAQSGEQSQIARRHAGWAADLADQSDEGQSMTAQAVSEFEPELDNARSAVEWALSHGEASLAARIASGFFGYFWNLRTETQLRHWLEMSMARFGDDVDPAVAARAWSVLAQLTFGLRKIEAAQRTVEFGERCNEPRRTVEGLNSMAYGLYQAGRHADAQVVIERSLKICRENGMTNSARYAGAICTLAGIAMAQGRSEEAQRSYEDALRRAAELGADSLATVASLNMCELVFRTGDARNALELAGGALVRARGARMTNGEVCLLANSAAYRLALEDVAGARTDARNALYLARGAYKLETSLAIQHLATVAALRDDPRRGARLGGYVDAWYRGQGFEREVTESQTYEILMTALREKMSNAEIETLAAEGAQLNEEQAVAEALTV